MSKARVAKLVRVTNLLQKTPSMVLKMKKMQQECKKFNKEHDKKIGASCDFHLECHINNKAGKITCPYCDLELTFTKLWGSENQASHKCAHEKIMPQIKSL